MVMSQTSTAVLVLMLTVAHGIPGISFQQYSFQPGDRIEKESLSAYNSPDSPPLSRKDGHDFFGPHDNWPHSQVHKDHQSLVVPGQTLAVNAELFYNLVLVPCHDTSIPIAGETRAYTASVSFNNQQKFRCHSREKFTEPIIPNKKDSNIYILQSEQYGDCPYSAEWLQYFNVTCPNSGRIEELSLDLEGRAKLELFDQGTLMFCVDYVKIDYTSSNSYCILCGRENLEDRCQQNFIGMLIVTFRSSRLNNFKGFKMNIVCYTAEEENLPGCIQTLPEWKERNMAIKEGHPYSTKFLPENAKEKLMTFYKSNLNTAHSFSATENDDMLQLAVLSENSCNAVLRAVGRGVSHLFPADMVTRARMNVLGWEYI